MCVRGAHFPFKPLHPATWSYEPNKPSLKLFLSEYFIPTRETETRKGQAQFSRSPGGGTDFGDW